MMLWHKVQSLKNEGHTQALILKDLLPNALV